MNKYRKGSFYRVHSNAGPIVQIMFNHTVEAGDQIFYSLRVRALGERQLEVPLPYHLLKEEVSFESALYEYLEKRGQQESKRIDVESARRMNGITERQGLPQTT
jgi:hypothetical protein